MINKIEHLPQDEYHFLTLRINDKYLIECERTIFGGLRVKCREKDSYGYMTNWCAGTNITFFELLINRTIGVIAADDLDAVPLCSDIKPAWKDIDFLKKIQDYNGQYIDLIPHPSNPLSFVITYHVKSC